MRKNVDIVVVPGGFGARTMLGNAVLLDWIRSAARALMPAQRTGVDPGARFHDSGSAIASAGIPAVIDCSLHLVGLLLGDDASAATAAHMEYERGR
jgi:transcriptional regulator GlxA family with amidase domain